MSFVENLKDNNIVEDGEIFDILQLDGIEVWGQNQKDLEAQALSQLNSLTESKNVQNENDAEISESKEISSNKNTGIKSISNINKYFENQAQLKHKYIRNKNNNISDKSVSAAKKISDLHVQKPKISNKTSQQSKKIKISTENSKSVKGEPKKSNPNSDSESEYCPSDEYESDCSESNKIRTNSTRKRKHSFSEIDEKVKDDGLLSHYTARLQAFNNADKSDDEFVIEDNLKILKVIWEKLYSYQQDGIKWLWNIHKQTVGGLLGDEMGLGKTVQVIGFLCALEYSKIRSNTNGGRYFGLGPSIIVCPATVIHQWVKHFHEWWPPFRVALLHQTGTFTGNKIQLINDINKTNGILITTYESVLKYKGVLIEKKWHYLILDEGHKIRNPSAKITVAIKQFRTPHKLILTGSPMQNNLLELWSLYDFIVPGKLGSQQAFLDYFVSPITQGGYTNATPTQETTALLIATSLKDMINPFMLRRTKDEVKDCIYLPNKSEQVLFCSLTEEQRDLYRGYLLSDHIGAILGRTKSIRTSENQTRANILVGITTLRKICNHPDLYLGEADISDANSNEIIPIEKSFGYYKRSGKMIVVAALLKIWNSQGHRVLLFTQTRAMIDIFEAFLRQQDYKYLKMDGATSVAHRQSFIDKFNQDTSYIVFLLTTRVGGLGVNLTGANRVIIYDPDWNPATDTQARERAWRIGQRQQVTVYRLVSLGTIEEKMYQRQVWKQLLSNKILIDPKTKRCFKTSDLNDLFSLQDHTDNDPETAMIFKNSKVDVNKNDKPSAIEPEIKFSKDKVDAMKLLAQQIAKNISQNIEKNDQINKEAEDIKAERPSPAELLAINRKKLEIKEVPITNKIDDCETNTTFSKALEVAEARSINYHKKPKKSNEDKSNNKNLKEETRKIDVSGEIDGEKVEGLIKREVKKRKKFKTKDSNQDDYVLKKLFSKTGVHTALQHDKIVQSGSPNRNNLKIHYEAKKKADMALKALRKSRINNWRW